MAKAETGADGTASFKVTKPGLWMLRTEVTESSPTAAPTSATCALPMFSR